jgi:hypothetical protein
MVKTITAKTTDDKDLELKILHLEWKRMNDLPDEYVIFAGRRKLKSLSLPKDVNRVHCGDNKIKKLILPKNLNYLSCDNNEISELKLHEGLVNLLCTGNNITKLNLPNSLKLIRCDNIELTGNLDCDIYINL